jgi:hypothetical protein
VRSHKSPEKSSKVATFPEEPPKFAEKVPEIPELSVTPYPVDCKVNICADESVLLTSVGRG